jgi:hypothetical protein
MPSLKKACETGRQFWDSFIVGDIDAFSAILAPDVVRLGPKSGNAQDVIRGKESYVNFIRDIKKTMPVHGGHTGHVGASADGRWVFVQCVEVVALAAGSTETTDVSNVLMMRINDDGLIDEIDIFRKEPEQDISWTKAADLMEASSKVGA